MNFFSRNKIVIKDVDVVFAFTCAGFISLLHVMYIDDKLAFYAIIFILRQSSVVVLVN